MSHLLKSSESRVESYRPCVAGAHASDIAGGCAESVTASTWLHRPDRLPARLLDGPQQVGLSQRFWNLFRLAGPLPLTMYCQPCTHGLQPRRQTHTCAACGHAPAQLLCTYGNVLLSAQIGQLEDDPGGPVWGRYGSLRQCHQQQNGLPCALPPGALRRLPLSQHPGMHLPATSVSCCSSGDAACACIRNHETNRYCNISAIRHTFVHHMTDPCSSSHIIFVV